jgi:hypothetical protein
MADDQPVILKRRKTTFVNNETAMVCVIHYEVSKDNEVIPMSADNFNTIQEAVRLRQCQTNPTYRLDSVCARVPDTFDSAIHGRHRWCYKNFTNVSRIRSAQQLMDNEDAACDVEEQQRRTSSRQPVSGASNVTLFPQDRCLFCDKGRKKVGMKEEELAKCVLQSAENSIQEAAIAKQDFLMMAKVVGVSLLAKEARYHNLCRRDYTRREGRPHHMMKSEKGKDSLVAEQRSAYNAAFQFICQYVRSNIIQCRSVERMTMLRQKNMLYIDEHSPEYYNPNYRAEKLKNRLIEHFGDKIQMWRPNNRSGDLVHSSDVTTGAAVGAFETATSETTVLKEAASILRLQTQTAHSKSADMPWPPSASYLTSDAVQLPESLKEFISRIISGSSLSKSSDKTKRLAKSFSQDICAATTGGRWKMPKHLLLGTTLRTLTGRADLLTLINRYGHCQSYTGIMELETAIAYQVQQQDTVLPSNISTTGNRVAHLCWDNFDVNEETPSGAGTTHSTHGIIIQEVFTTGELSLNESTLPRSGERSFKPKLPHIPPCFSKKCGELSVSVSFCFCL